MRVRVPPSPPFRKLYMRVELRLYPNIESQETESYGIFQSLKDAWHHAEFLTTITNLRDFFTMELPDEVDNGV